MLYLSKDSFTSSLVWIQFILFYCLISLTRTCNIILNRNGKSRYPCLIPDLGGKIQSFTVNHDTSCGLLKILIIKLKCLSIPTQLSIFIIKGCWICHFFFWCLFNWLWGFFPFLLWLYITLIDFYILNQLYMLVINLRWPQSMLDICCWI